MSEFNGGGYETTEQVSKPGKSMKPGVHVAIISEVNYACVGEKKSKYIEIVVSGEPVKGLKAKGDEKGADIGQVAKTTMWMTPGAWDIAGAMWCTKARLTVIARNLGVEEQFNAIKGKDEEDFVNQFSALVKGKKARFLIGGKEDQFENDKGETITFVRPEIYAFGFIESLDIPATDSKLVYKESMVKKLEVADAVTEDFATDTSTDEVAWGE